MKINRKTFKVLVAFLIVLGTIFWVANYVRPLTYSGANLNFGVRGGPVNVTNPSQETIPVQVLGTGYGVFTISSTTEGLSGTSARQGTGGSTTQLFEFGLPPGTSEFTIARGTNVNFVANTATSLQATVNPVSNSVRQTTIIMAVIVIVVVLFYASNVTGHSWMSVLRRKDTSTPDTQPIAAISDGGQGGAPRSYGDNRVHTSH